MNFSREICPRRAYSACERNNRSQGENNGFSLLNKNGKPTIVFPEAYTNVCIGGVAVGAVFKGGNFLVRRTKIGDTNQEMIDKVSLYGYKRLDEPEFYCTEVTYSVLPSTKQVVSIRMTGDLSVRKTSNADRMIREIKQWMKEDYGAVESVPPRLGGCDFVRTVISFLLPSCGYINILI